DDRFIDEIPGYVLYIRKKHGNDLQDVRIYTVEKNQITQRTSAKSGTIAYDEGTQVLKFKLVDVLTETLLKRDPAKEAEFIGPPPPEKPDEWQPLAVAQYDMDLDVSSLTKSERKPKLTEMNFRQLQNERGELESRGISTMPVLVQMHRQV